MDVKVDYARDFEDIEVELEWVNKGSYVC